MKGGTAMKAAVLVFSSVLVAFVLGEFSGRLLYSDRLRLLQDPDHRLAPNQKPSPNQPHSVTNSQGIRSLVEPSQVREEDVNVVFLGDSFAFGLRMPPDKALPQRLEARARALNNDTKINVFNFGWTTSSPLLSARLLKDIGKDYKPDTVILLLDISSDFHDDLKFNSWLAKRGLHRLIDVAPFTYFALRTLLARSSPEIFEWLFAMPLDRFFLVNRPLAESREYLDFTVSVIDEMATFTETQLGAKFILVAFPRNFMYSDRETPNNWEAWAYTPLGPYVLEPFRFLDEVRSSKSYPYLSLLPTFAQTDIFPTTFDDDPHWNDAGTNLAMSAIFEFCLQHRCFENR